MGDLRYSAIETPLGSGFYAYNERGVAMVTIGSERRFLSDARKRFSQVPQRMDPPPDLAERVKRCAERGDGTAVDWDSLSGFQRRALEACAQIPWGQVQSYGDLAKVMGAPGAARAVGTAMARNPIPMLIPCHRVVKAGGETGGYGLGGTAAKERLLTVEGARPAPLL